MKWKRQVILSEHTTATIYISTTPEGELLIKLCEQLSDGTLITHTETILSFLKSSGVLSVETPGAVTVTLPAMDTLTPPTLPDGSSSTEPETGSTSSHGSNSHQGPAAEWDCD